MGDGKISGTRLTYRAFGKSFEILCRTEAISNIDLDRIPSPVEAVVGEVTVYKHRGLKNGDRATQAELLETFGSADQHVCVSAILADHVKRMCKATRSEQETLCVPGSMVADTSADVARDEVAEKLVNRGFNIKQLLEFCHAYFENQKISPGMTTADVVREIVIPETHSPPRCYMESAFMQQHGGGQRARKLVSHAWKSEFLITVLNIVLDATGWSHREFFEKTFLNEKNPFYADGKLDSLRLLRTLDAHTLDMTYWLCIFAVDEHRAICGDCWSCNTRPEWLADPSKHLQVEECLLCQTQKFNPCRCGTLKYTDADPDYEINKFTAVVSQMDALVVSLDPELNAIRRVWVVAEIGQAIQFAPVFLRNVLGLVSREKDKLKSGSDLIESVEYCQACSDADRRMILDDLRKMEGGIDAYNQLVNCMLEVSFGRCTRMSQLSRTGAATIGRLTQLEMDFTWYPELTNLSDLLGDGTCFAMLDSLCNLSMNFSLTHISDLSTLSLALQHVKMLKNLSLDFTGTRASDVCPLGIAVQSLTNLQSLILYFTDTRVANLSVLGQGLSQLVDLQYLSLIMAKTQITDVSPIGAALENLVNLKHLQLNLASAKVTDVSALCAGLEYLTNLQSLLLSFYKTRIADISTLGFSLQQLLHLQRLLLHLNCTQVSDMSVLGEALVQLTMITDFRVVLNDSLVPQILQRTFHSRADFIQVLTTEGIIF